MRNDNLENLLTRAFPRVACLSAILLGGASFANATDLPDGPGMAETMRVCGKCHSLDQATSPIESEAELIEALVRQVGLAE
jgi:hypothetical protein